MTPGRESQGRLVAARVGPVKNASADRAWADEAMRKVIAENNRSADTHLYSVPLPEHWGVQLYLKDESTHRSGSLKHRLARSLFLFGLVNGWIGEGTTIVEASSGSTAVSEAYFAQLLGLPFVAVMTRTTSPEKIALIEQFGGSCLLVDHASEVYAVAADVAATSNGHYMDQFTYAERATDWRGNNNIAESIIGQLANEPSPVPAWIVCGAGTGGTSATLGRYLRYRGLDTFLCVAEPSGSAFAHGWRTRDRAASASRPTLIEGIGRPRVEPGFLFDIVDHVIEVPDAASISAAWLLEEMLGRRYGGSSGTNFVACLQLASAMRDCCETGSIVSLLCDRGERYAETLFDPAWLSAHAIDRAAWDCALRATVNTGEWHPPTGA